MPLAYETLKNLHAEVIAYLEKGMPEKAKNKLNELPVNDADNLFVEYMYGICEQELGNIERAVKRFKYVVKHDPAFVQAAEALAFIGDDLLTIGEKKYIYKIITAHKPDQQSKTEFILEHAKVSDELILSAAEKPIQTMEEFISETVSETEPAAIAPNPDETPVLTADATASDAAEEVFGEEEIDIEILTAEDAAILPKEQAEATQFVPESIVEPFPETPAKSAEPAPVSTKTATEPKEALPVPPPSPRKRSKSQQKVASYETYTMATVYIEQGFYQQALEILEKLLEKGEDKEKIETTIAKVIKRMSTEKQ